MQQRYIDAKWTLSNQGTAVAAGDKVTAYDIWQMVKLRAGYWLEDLDEW